MSSNLDLVTGTDILTQLAREHYYASVIVSIIPEIAHLINENEQLHKTMVNILKQINFDETHSVTWSQLEDDEMEVIDNFFDYLYFTSTTFLEEAR
jgi:hypothetical protein